MARRKTTTLAVRSAARRNIAKAQTSRFRLRQPRQVGRIRRARSRSSY